VEHIVKAVADATTLALEATTILFIAYGALEAFGGVANHMMRGHAMAGWRNQLFSRFGVWLLLALQFALAADIVRSVIVPTWTEIGQLGVIAVIRTFLSYFLERDMREVSRSGATAVT